VSPALGDDLGDPFAAARVDDIPGVFLERRHVDRLAVGRDRHPVGAVGRFDLPDYFVGQQIQAKQLRAGREIEPARRGAGTDSFDIVRHFLPAGRRGNAADELVPGVDIEHQNAGPAEFQIIPNTGADDVQVAMGRRIGSGN
jgi:hypothetical protein